MERATKNVRLGLTLPVGSADGAAELARAAQGCGYEEIWLAEVNGGDAYAIAGALAASVPGMRIGTAVVPAQTRTPLVHAMAALSLSQLGTKSVKGHDGDSCDSVQLCPQQLPHAGLRSRPFPWMSVVSSGGHPSNGVR